MKKTIKCLFIFIFFSVIPEKNLHAQFLEPGVGVGLVSYSGDLQRGYSIRSAALGFELFQRLNLSKHISVKGGIKKGTIKGKEKILDALSQNRNFSFKTRSTEFSIKIEYNFLDFFDETGDKIFTHYLFLGAGIGLFKNVEQRYLKVSKKNSFNLIMPLGLGFKYLYRNRFSIGIEFEMKKTLSDLIDSLENKDLLVKNYQYGNPNSNDYYYFTGLSISYVLYTIPCPQKSAPSNNIY